MKLNRQVLSNCRCLPPNVEGVLKGALTMQVDEILWFKKITKDVIVSVQWWGEQEPLKFRPLRSNCNVGNNSSVVVFTYRIYTAPQLFYSYLEDSKQLSLVVVDENLCLIGSATLCNLREAFTEQSTKQIRLPVVDGHGVKIAELYLNVTLKFFKNICDGKINSAGLSGSTTEFPVVQKAVRSYETQRALDLRRGSQRGVPDSLVEQLLWRARRLRDAMARSALEDWEETDVRQHRPERRASEPSDEKLLSGLLDLDDAVPYEAMEVLNEVEPSAEMLELVASLGDAPRSTGTDPEQQGKQQLPANGETQPKEAAECSAMTSATFEKQPVSAVSVADELLEMVVSMRVCVSSLHLQVAPVSHGTYFVEYEVPHCLVAGCAPLARTTCSRRLVGRAVQFGQRFVHTVSRQGPALAALLRDMHLLFRVYCRQLSDRKRSLLGQATLSLAGLARAERLEVHQELAVRGVGKLRVIVQLGSDKAQFSRREAGPSGRTAPGDGGPLPAAADDDPGMQVYSRPAVTDTPRETLRSGQQQLLYVLLHVPCGRLESPSDTYLVCRAFWRDHVLTSDVARDGCNPRYQLHQVLPLLLSPELLERCRDNVLVLEAWRAGPDALLGLAKVSLHPFYLAYKDPIMVSQLLRAKNPVISADKWVPVVCPGGGGVRGELRVLLALGSEDQVQSLVAGSRSMPGPAGDGPGNLPTPQEAAGDSQHVPSAGGDGVCLVEDVRPPQSNRPESCSCGGHKQKHAVRESTNFSKSCSKEMHKQKKGKKFDSNKSVHVCACSCKTAQGMLEKLTDDDSDDYTSKNNVPASRDLSARLQHLSSRETREKHMVCSSGCSSDTEEPMDTRKGDLPDTDAASVLRSSVRSEGHGNTILSDLHRNMMMLNLAGGDTLQVAKLAALGQQSWASNPGAANERTRENFAVENTLNSFSPSHSNTTGSTKVGSVCDFNGEVDCGGMVSVGCDTENQAVYVSDSTSTKQAEESAETWSARVTVEQAVHLRLGVPWSGNDRPKVYVTFQAHGGARPLTSPALEASERPVWGWHCDSQLAAHLLNNEGQCLVVRVWQMAAADPDAVADTVLGFAVVNLTMLSRGSTCVSGWYNLVDYAGSCSGQIKVTVEPLEDLSRFSNSAAEVEPHVQEDHDHLEADLYSNLKEKLNELDDITARLRQRLGTVLSDERMLCAPSTDASTLVVGPEMVAASTSCQESMLEDKGIQTSMFDEDSDALTDWLMGQTVRDLELENVFNPLLFQPLISSCVEQSKSPRDAESRRSRSGPTAGADEPGTSAGGSSRPQTVAERLQMLWNGSGDLCEAPRQAPDGVSMCENSTSASQLSGLEETNKTGKT
ncbi:uncharacterized protein LOC134532778 isoform X3 [Bacillus rossius redtenbacheri]|uniref:uncharacterized protein LOC134532778 isoform X3 n=1 Tax=Bacillus rossius redtenbacheri TaxID=93214 RepID=UPI002FDD7507